MPLAVCKTKERKRGQEIEESREVEPPSKVFFKIYWLWSVIFAFSRARSRAAVKVMDTDSYQWGKRGDITNHI